MPFKPIEEKYLYPFIDGTSISNNIHWSKQPILTQKIIGCEFQVSSITCGVGEKCALEH